MRILLVNDDGYNSQGIKALEEKLKKYGEVYVVAPYQYMSGKATAITILDPMKLRKFDDHHYALEGTPADCTSFGLTGLNLKFDLTVSGINDGLNITYDILHSGTCGACIESLMYGVPAIAFSDNHNLDFVLNYFEEAFDFVLKHHLLSNEHVVNVNFPAIDKYLGIKIAKIINRNDNRYFIFDGDNVIPKRIMDDHNNYDHDSENYLVFEGYTTISFLNKDFYSESKFNEIKLKITKAS